MDLSKTAVWVVSDHGAKSMRGGFMFNQWLMNEGCLHLKQKPAEQQKFDVNNVDWSKTTAWGDGGYYGRFFMNVEGREPSGVIPKSRYKAFRDEMATKIEAIVDHEGHLMGNKCYRPEEIYKQANGVPPDLVVIFGDLRWRSVGQVGSNSVYTFENDTGPDDANHAQQGMYIVAHPSRPARGRVDGPTLYDVTPTVLTQLGLAVPPDMRGRAI
jgi:predicted AlkP superfamily phosphohydrolase/phosphomutase